MDDFRENLLKEIGHLKVTRTIDYLYDETGNSKSNVLKYYLEDGSWYTVRPSGTEPKIKLYIYSKADSWDKAGQVISLIEDAFNEKMNKVQ